MGYKMNGSPLKFWPWGKREKQSGTFHKGPGTWKSVDVTDRGGNIRKQKLVEYDDQGNIVRKEKIKYTKTGDVKKHTRKKYGTKILGPK